MRIGIVNDMPLAVEALRRTLLNSPEHSVIWIAENGAEAVALCAQEAPDLILMDLLMPVMNGVEATRRIMASTPCMILLVTASVQENSSMVFEALGHGALDALDMPALFADASDIGTTALLTKLESMEGLLGKRHRADKAVSVHSVLPAPQPSLVAIGSSAGGPAALASILSQLPKDFPGAIVIIQHIDEKFIPQMAKWLGQQSELPVRLAAEGDPPKAGVVLIAGRSDHLTFKTANSMGYSHQPSDYVYRPSVDVFFKSICKLWAGKAIGILLTGMGRDGAIGLQAMRQKGHYTITQDQKSSAVYGMPKAAASLGAAVDILPLDKISHRLINIFAEQKEVRF